MADSEIDVTSSIKHFIKSNYGFPMDSSTEFVYADSSLALFNKVVLCCIQEGGTLCFPAGSNGNYVSAAKFLKANIVNIFTKSKLTEKILSEIGNVLSTCAKFGARVVIDTSFSGLEFDSESWGGWDLEGSLSKLTSAKPSFGVSLLAGLSLKMLTGELKFGFLVRNQSLLVDTFNNFPGLSKPHSTIKYAIKKLLGLRERKSGDLLDGVAEQIRNLRSRSKQLKETLENCGWDCAGVFMVAKPSAYLNKIVKLKNLPKDGGSSTDNDVTYEVKLDDINIREAISRPLFMHQQQLMDCKFLAIAGSQLR
ncbi:methionine s-methyltransferase [Fagus crenata]